MAKQIMGCLSGLRKGDVSVAWVTLTLLLALFRGDVLGAGAAPSGSTPSNAVIASNAVVVPLEYQAAGFDLVNLGVPLSTQTTHFRKEPPGVAGKIVRGALSFGGSFGGDSSQSIPFLWQCDAKKLCLDLNRNQDLTDDPAGVLSLAGPQAAFNVQTFTNAPLVFNTAAGRSTVLANLTLYDYGGPQPICTVALRSFWQGKLTLQRRDWQVGLVPNDLNNLGSFQSARLLLRPWEQRNQPFSTLASSSATVPFSRSLFVDGRAFQVECVTRTQDGEARPSLQFVEKPVALGEVKITGQFISRLVLAGGPYEVVLDQPAGVVNIPPGAYTLSGVRLEHNGTAAYLKSGQPQASLRVSAEDKTPAVLNAGGPLTNSVAVSRDGRDLDLDYQLVGAGGLSYKLAAQDLTKPPSFAIYKGEKKIDSGDFEFG